MESKTPSNSMSLAPLELIPNGNVGCCIWWIDRFYDKDILLYRFGCQYHIKFSFGVVQTIDMCQFFRAICSDKRNKEAKPETNISHSVYLKKWFLWVTLWMILNLYKQLKQNIITLLEKLYLIHFLSYFQYKKNFYL